MPEDRKESKGIDRRQFLTGAGAVAITGAIAGLAACSPSTTKTEDEAPISGVITHDPTVCSGCGVCGLMCSLYHEGEQGPALARSGVVRDPFTYEFTFNVCQQCRSPSCYFACPLKDTALCIDSVTGARYVNEKNCTGCEKCIEACPFDPPRIVLHPEKKVVFSCDLCMGRDKGPICVEYCSMKALRYVTKDERKENGEVVRLDREYSLG